MCHGCNGKNLRFFYFHFSLNIDSNILIKLNKNINKEKEKNIQIIKVVYLHFETLLQTKHFYKMQHILEEDEKKN